jgi:hypothetical protein
MIVRLNVFQYFFVSITLAVYTAGLLNAAGFATLYNTFLLTTPAKFKLSFLDWTVQAAQVSRLSLLANLNACLAGVLIIFNATCHLFLGELRLIEEYNLRERIINFVLFKIIFIGAIVEPELLELMCWASCFVILGVIKMLGSLGHDRFEHVAVAPNITTVAHVRLISLLSLVLICCGVWTYTCVKTFWVGGGPSVVLLLLFECMTCIIMVTQTLAKYAVHGIDAYLHNGEWEWRGPLWYFIGFGGDIVSLTVSTGHYLHVWSLNGKCSRVVWCPLLLCGYCGTVVLWNCGTVVLVELWNCGTVVLWYCGTVVLWYCGTVVLWYCGTVVLWNCGTVELWY